MNTPPQGPEGEQATGSLITTWYLEMRSPDQFKPGQGMGGSAEVRQAREPCGEVNRMFYEAVGRSWHWAERLVWTEEAWRRHAARPNLATWIGYVSDTPFGYFELESEAEGQVELAIFGVLQLFVGRGLGRYLLSRAVEQAWAGGARRVWVHTCSLDHPGALANYQARGFSIYDILKEPPSGPVARSLAGKPMI